VEVHPEAHLGFRGIGVNVHGGFLELGLTVMTAGHRGLEHHDGVPTVLVQLAETPAHLVRVDDGTVERLTEALQ